ncbi:hypothetical protein MRX96_003864 [Rhipicephalus microplus]
MRHGSGIEYATPALRLYRTLACDGSRSAGPMGRLDGIRGIERVVRPLKRPFTQALQPTTVTFEPTQ